mmetsp:Transcript_18193/g.31951  ORF Transcript_18193/g.31951 Transcript_18193/m.31951 type:complete len:151 (-) Transcript_18193:38-490(-)
MVDIQPEDEEAGAKSFKTLMVKRQREADGAVKTNTVEMMSQGLSAKPSSIEKAATEPPPIFLMLQGKPSNASIHSASMFGGFLGSFGYVLTSITAPHARSLHTDYDLSREDLDFMSKDLKALARFRLKISFWPWQSHPWLHFPDPEQRSS